MAEVDFSHARIEPLTAMGSFPNIVNPVSLYGYLSLTYGSYLYDANENTVASMTHTVLINTSNQLVVLFQGTFSTSGTEFYIIGTSYPRACGWKVSNISFNSGDTYVFQINATLTCN